MLFVLLLLSIVFYGISFLVTKENAASLLSGYNTLNKTEQEKFNLDAYLPFFKRFHHFLGISLLVSGLVIYFFSSLVAGIFLSLYPIVAYTYFIWRGSQVSGYPMNRSTKLSLGLLGAILVGITWMLVVNMRDNPMVLDGDQIVFEGAYGETIEIVDIERIALVEELPGIKMKANGFGLGPVRKGTFKTVEGERIKLLLSTDEDSYVLITRKEGEKLYYSSRGRSSAEVLEQLAAHFPGVSVAGKQR